MEESYITARILLKNQESRNQNPDLRVKSVNLDLRFQYLIIKFKTLSNFLDVKLDVKYSKINKGQLPNYT